VGFWVYLAGPLLGGLAGAAASGLVPKKRPVVLFVCVHNAGRSQMAAAFARSLGGSSVDVRSAGSAPGERVHPNVKAAMAEVGLPLDASPRRLTDDDLAAADVVVTMGCGDECVAKAGARREDWVLEDPAVMDLATTRRIRDEIRARVSVLLALLRQR
jgi:protein-tyrosine-phosphatase